MICLERGTQGGVAVGGGECDHSPDGALAGGEQHGVGALPRLDHPIALADEPTAYPPTDARVVVGQEDRGGPVLFVRPPQRSQVRPPPHVPCSPTQEIRRSVTILLPGGPRAPMERPTFNPIADIARPRGDVVPPRNFMS